MKMLCLLSWKPFLRFFQQHEEGKVWAVEHLTPLVELAVVLVVVAEGRHQGIEKDGRKCMAVNNMDEVVVKGDIKWDAQTILKPRFLTCWNQSMSICLF